MKSCQAYSPLFPSLRKGLLNCAVDSRLGSDVTGISLLSRLGSDVTGISLLSRLGSDVTGISLLRKLGRAGLSLLSRLGSDVTTWPGSDVITCRAGLLLLGITGEKAVERAVFCIMLQFWGKRSVR